MSVLLVTGASRGIGAEITRLAAVRGWKVAINYASSATQANSVVKQIKNNGGQASAYQADVSNADQVESMFCGIDKALGQVLC